MLLETDSQAALGEHIRSEVLPSGISVKAAAESLDVGRIALSNLLNGKATLSVDMAARLERTFGANSVELLERQERIARASRDTAEKTFAIRPYVPSFLKIKALQIEAWAHTIDARHLLPVLLRTLIHSTASELRKVDFPGHDNAQRHGWDGEIEADAATAWVPEGRSGWEFGTNAEPEKKANSDLAARVAAIPASERADLTYVFVTPRNWPGKARWEKEQNVTRAWKAVRVLDASDLEQWLEASVPAQIWLGEKLGLPRDGWRTLEMHWHEWAGAADPALADDLFAPSVTKFAETLKSWLEGEPGKLFVVSADSAEEAAAFLRCLFRHESIEARWSDLTALFDSGQTLRQLASSAAPFIPITINTEAEKELAPLYRRLHCIAIRPRNDIQAEPDVSVELLTHEAFAAALKAMGKEGDEALRLERDSGRSPTVLRRCLSPIPEVRTPRWAKEERDALSLIPMALAGAWQATSPADTDALARIAGRPYAEVEQDVVRLRRGDDAPLWSVGQYHGVKGKLPTLFAIMPHMTAPALERFFPVAADILAEHDPSLELPEDEQWAANVYGKVRKYSAALRSGVGETLVILSVHSEQFQRHANIVTRDRVDAIIHKLLTPLTLDKLRSHDGDLPRYAEASPRGFLKLIQDDLKKPQPILLGLLAPVSSGLFTRCPRTGLLWALEGLGWQNLPPVSRILAQLSLTQIDDNWANKPIASLSALFRSWMPQTAAPLSERIKVLEELVRDFPDVAWEICIQQFDPSHRTGFYSHKPALRDDAIGQGEPRTGHEHYEFCRKAFELALAWESHTASQLGDLVQHVEGIPEEEQGRVWDLIDDWAERTTDEKAKATLRETIRRFAFTRRGRRQGRSTGLVERARSASAKLAAHDPLVRDAYLFAKDWVEESADQIHDVDFDFKKHGERIHADRQKAMHEIFSRHGFAGIQALLADSEGPATIGRYAALNTSEASVAVTIIERLLALEDDPQHKADRCLEGFLLSLDAELGATVIKAVLESTDAAQTARLLRSAPFGGKTWKLVDERGPKVAEDYWRKVSPWWRGLSDEDLLEAIDRLLAARRPRAAFFAAHLDWDKVETSRLKRLLHEVATVGDEDETKYRLNGHEVSDALDALEGRPGVTDDEMARLEFLYLRGLERTSHGIKNLEQQISRSPMLFVQAVALTYRRRDDGEDPPEWRVSDPDRHASLVATTHRLLSDIHRTPGSSPDGKSIDLDKLLAWVNETRALCAQHGRAEMGDHCIGQLLARSSPGPDGAWPRPEVCEALETTASEEIDRGFLVGVHNARGVVWRGRGGDQERELAAKYRTRSLELANEFPYVSRLLEDLAASYERDASWHDTRSELEDRLGR
jgi:plasmid maintenance system antidote protein VapI